MTTTDYEKAIDGLNVYGIELIRFSYGINGQVVAVYAMLGDLTWLKWDQNGRGIRFEQPEGEENCVSSIGVQYLDYQRDNAFDLTFE